MTNNVRTATTVLGLGAMGHALRQRLLMMGATADHIVGASNAAGIDVALPNAIKSHYDRAAAAGHGRDNWTSLYEVIKKRPA